MSQSPGDLAVAFRSFGRRLDEAMAPTKEDPARADTGSPSARELGTQLAGVVAEAATVLGVSAPVDVREGGATVADAIAAIPPDHWDDARLERLRSLALDGGRLLREIEAAVARAAS
jgi:hypothetical protein